jgi:hypothetical protein
MAYLIFISIAMMVGLSGVIENGEFLNVGLITSLFIIVIPLHLFSMFCTFYSLYFVAKTYKTVELQREVSYYTHKGEFADCKLLNDSIIVLEFTQRNFKKEKIGSMMIRIDGLKAFYDGQSFIVY